jgi:hypothetical protein
MLYFLLGWLSSIRKKRGKGEREKGGVLLQTREKLEALFTS